MSLYTAVSLGSSTANSTWNRFIITFPPKPVGLRVFSKNDILPACRKRCAHPLAPSARVTPHSVGRCREATEGPGPEGLRPQAVGERTVRLPEIFRAMARFSPSAPSGHLPRRGRFFDRLALPLTREAFSFWHIFSSFFRFWNIFRLFCTNWLLLRFLLYYNDKV